MRLSLVVPATDEPATLARCLEEVRAAQEPPDETVVVTSPARSGPAAARNAGAERATGDIVVFVDADVLVHADAFTRIRAAFARDPGLVAVFGSYDDVVATDGVVAGFRNLLHHTMHQRSAGDAATFWAGLGAVRKDAFATAGGFDAVRYPRASIEDIELGTRLCRLGRILLDPHLQGTHLKQWTLPSMVVTDFARRGVPWVALMAERRTVPATLNLGARERMSALAAVASLGAVVSRRPGLGAGALGACVALNLDLYGTVWRRLGARAAVAGIPLHVLHQLVAVAAVPAGLFFARRSQPARGRSQSSRPGPGVRPVT